MTRHWFTWQNVALLVVVIFVAGVRLRLRDMPLERDEGEFAYAGQLMLQGIPPYKLCYNMKQPGIYAAYAGVMAVFGQSASGVHVGAMVVNLIAVALVWFLARRFLDQTGAAAAAVAYAVCTLSPAMLGLAAHATQFVTAAGLAGLLLLARACEKPAWRRFLGSGFFFGVAFLLKQPGAMFGFFGLTVVMWPAFGDFTRWRDCARRAAVVALGGIAPIALTMLLMLWAGVFERYWFWTFHYAYIYATAVPLSGGWLLLNYYFRGLADLWIWVAAGLGLAALLARRGGNSQKLLLVGLMFFTGVAVVADFRFAAHYFVMLAPALALLTGVGASALGARWRWAAPAALAALCLTVVWGHRDVFFKLSPEAACLRIYGTHPFIEGAAMGRFIREHSSPDDTVAVLGSEPEILFYAHRRSATGYIYMYDLLAPHGYALAMQQEMEKQIEGSRPAFMVMVFDDNSWSAYLQTETNPPIGQWASQYYHEHYTPMALALVRNPPEYFWSFPSFPSSYEAPFLILGKRSQGDR